MENTVDWMARMGGMYAFGYFGVRWVIAFLEMVHAVVGTAILWHRYRIVRRMYPDE